MIRTLPADELSQAVRDLDSLFAVALEKAADAEGRFHGRLVCDLVLESTITTAPPVTSRRLSEVSDVEVIGAIEDFFGTLERDDKWDERGLDQLYRALKLRGPNLGVSHVDNHGDKLSVYWTAEIHDKQVWPSITREIRAAFERIQRDQERETKEQERGQANRRRAPIRPEASERDWATLRTFQAEIWNVENALLKRYSKTAKRFEPLVVEALTIHLPSLPPPLSWSHLRLTALKSIYES